MRHEDVPQEWKAALRREDPVVVGMLSDREVGELIAAVAPLIATAERERCARVAEPKYERCCDCSRCDCQNVGDAQAAACWDEATAAAAIRALKDTDHA